MAGVVFIIIIIIIIIIVIIILFYASIYPQNGKPYLEWNMYWALFKRQYKQHYGEKMAMWNFAHSQFIKLWKSNANTNWNFH